MNAIIQTPTSNLAHSLDFYSKLKFNIVSKEKPTIVSDGKATIEINPERTARAGMKLFRDSWDDVIKLLEKQVRIHKTANGFLLGDPSGAWIYLVEGKPEIAIEVAESASSILGNFAGMSLETTDLKKSIAIWGILGFEKTMGSEEQGWLVLQNKEGAGVSLMKPFSCPHLFFNPSLTYFNGKNNLGIIRQIRELGIPITEEITHFNEAGIVDNIIIRDPGGLGFFIFSD